MSKNLTNDFTSGSIPRHLLKFSVPYLMSNLLQACYGAVDTIVVGQTVGAAGTAAIGVGAQLMVVITAACSGLCMGGTVTLSHHKGSGDTEGQIKTIGTFFSSLLIAAVILSVLGVLFSGTVVELLNTPVQSVDLANSYLRICCCGIVFIFGYNGVCAVFRGLGNSRYPLYFITIASVLNIVLDIVFVVILKMSSYGAALATVIAQGCSFLLALIFLIRQKNFIFRFKLKQFRIVSEKLRMILKVGIPSMMQTMIVHMSLLIVGSMINAYGLAASAANSIGTRISNFFILPRQAIAFATGNIVGQNMGAGKSDRAASTVKLGVVFSLSVAIVLFAIINIFPAVVTSIFDRTPEVITESERYIHIVSIAYLFMAPMTVYNNLAIGVGNSKRSMINSITDSLIVRIPACYLLGELFGLGLTGIYWGMAISPIAAVFMGWHYFHYGNWRNVSLLKKVKK